MLALCAAQLPHTQPSETLSNLDRLMLNDEWIAQHGYAKCDLPTGVTATFGMHQTCYRNWAESIRERVLAWLRWPGKPRAAGIISGHGPAFMLAAKGHPLDVVASWPERASITFAACRACDAAAAALHAIRFSAVPSPSDLNYRAKNDALAHVRAHRLDPPVDHAGVLVLLDAVERLGAWPEIHAWRPAAEITTIPPNMR